MRENRVSRIILIAAFVSLIFLPLSPNAQLQGTEADSRIMYDSMTGMPFYILEIDEDPRTLGIDVSTVNIGLMTLADERGLITGRKQVVWYGPPIEQFQTVGTASSAETVDPDPIRTPDPGITPDASTVPEASESEKSQIHRSVAPGSVDEVTPLRNPDIDVTQDTSASGGAALGESSVPGTVVMPTER